jgi:cytochrome d ubiquinol oxidase subunit I
MRTADGLSPVPGASVATSLALFVVVYGIVFSMGIYYINRLIAKGPPAAAGQSTHPTAGRPLAEGGAGMREIPS